MQVNLGNLHTFQMENYESRFKVPTVKSHFCDDLAKLYKPIIYGGDYSAPEPEGIYYRILYKNNLNIYCIQYLRVLAGTKLSWLVTYCRSQV